MDRLSFLQNHFLYTTIVIFIGISCIFHTSPIVLFRPSKSRVLFETISTDGIKCLDTCAKYNRAQAPTFSDQAEYDEMLAWAISTTTDPMTKLYYKDVVSATFWLPIT